MNRKKGEREVLEIVDILLEIDSNDSGGVHYKQKQHIEDANSQIYQKIRERLDPKVVVDIGANYGFTGSLFAKRFNPERIVLVEPDPRVFSYMVRNIRKNTDGSVELITMNCLIGSEVRDSASFHINPNGSQDNRVIPAGKWIECFVKEMTLQSLLDQYVKGKPAFIKIDTQGYDPIVFYSGEEYLQSKNNWLVRTEFAPKWIWSQGLSPQFFLEYLTNKFDVFEVPARFPFFYSLEENLHNKIPKEPQRIERFIEYVGSLNQNKTGWLDLFVMPKDAKWMV